MECVLLAGTVSMTENVVTVAPKREIAIETPALLIAPRQPNRYKHFHMFQLLVHKNNDF